MMKDTKVFYQWDRDKISMGIPVAILIKENNLNTPYRHVVCLYAVRIN